VVEIIELECPGCGAPITRETTKCIYCHKEMIIKHDDRSCHAQHYEVHVEPVSTNYHFIPNDKIIQDIFTENAELPVVKKSFFIVFLLTLFVPMLGFQYLYLRENKSFAIRLGLFFISGFGPFLIVISMGVYFFDLFRLVNGYYRKRCVGL
jgi:hypothetical protein